MDHPLYYSAVWGKRGFGYGSTPSTWLSSITLLLWLPSFPPQALPTIIFSLTAPRSDSLPSTAALALGLIHNPYSPAPSHCTFQGTCIPAQCMYGCGKDCLILFQLGCHRSAVSLSALNVPPLTQTIALMWRADPCFSSPTCWGQAQSYEHSCFSP